MFFRFHRGSLAESMATMTTVDTLEQLEAYIAACSPPGWIWTTKADGPLRFAYCGFDERTAWDTWYVSDRHGVVGMASGSFEGRTTMRFLLPEVAKALGIVEGSQLTLIGDGRLIRCKWDYNEATKEGLYRYADVTNSAVHHLFERVDLVPGQTRLKHVLQLTRQHIEVLEPVIGNWCREVIAVGLRDIKPWTGEYDPNGIEYLELSRLFEIEPDYDDDAVGEDFQSLVVESKRPYLNGGDFLHFHGIGYELREDNDQLWLKGDRIPWGVAGTNINELADIPLRINREAKLWDGRPKAEKKADLGTYVVEPPRLIDAIYAIFWELTWYGRPADPKVG